MSMAGGPNDEKRKKMSCGLEIDCPMNIRDSLTEALDDCYHFIVTHAIHPQYTRKLFDKETTRVVSRTDRLLGSQDWNRLIVGKVNPSIEVDSEVEHVRRRSRAELLQELGFASHLSLAALMIKLRQRNNANLGSILYNKMVAGVTYQLWIEIPMVHPSRFSALCQNEQSEDTWSWWNDLRSYCNYDKPLLLVLELPDHQHLPSSQEIDRWIGEPISILVIPTSLFIPNNHNQPVLRKAHQELIQRFLTLNVQYVIRGPPAIASYKNYWAYLNFLGKKLYMDDSATEFVSGCEDYLQNPLQPLTENLETMVYEVFEKDQIKYNEYQRAIQKALEDLPGEIETAVVMVVGAGRGPIVQAALNASYIIGRKIKLYAIEKNPYAISTLEDRVRYEWKDRVTLVNQDMRVYEPPEKADILVSELLGSFGDNELSPECLDGAQRFLKNTGISIPQSYTSFIAPIQSLKIHNEIKTIRANDKTLEAVYETPYVVHLVNYYQIAQSKELFKFEHPNWNDYIDNNRYGRLHFNATQNCVLSGFVGYFETVLYKDVMLSINPQTYSKGMVSWFPIVFPFQNPVQVKGGDSIDVSFWRSSSEDKVWYQWCLESPVKTGIINPNGRSYSIRKS